MKIISKVKEQDYFAYICAFLLLNLLPKANEDILK